MSRSEFRWNKKRKHYTYLFKDIGDYRKNILIHSDPTKKHKLTKKQIKQFLKKNVKLFRHPNPRKPRNEAYYVEKRIYVDLIDSFDERIYAWSWDKNDKRIIKRIKKGRRTR